MTTPFAFLGVLRVFAVKGRRRMNREGAKNAKNFAKQNPIKAAVKVVCIRTAKIRRIRVNPRAIGVYNSPLIDADSAGKLE